MKQAFTSAAFLIATGVITFGASQGCSSDKAGNGFGDQVDSGNADVYVPPPVGTDQPDSGDVIGDGCGGGNAKTEEPVTFLEFITDGSGSMDDGKKRPAQEGALKAVFEDIKNKTVDAAGTVINAKVGVGMIYFGPSGSYPQAADVFPGLVDGAQLAKLVARVNAFPDGGTPTYEALLGGYSALDNFVPFPPLPAKGKKIAILLSDGVPNGNVPQIYSLVKTKLTQPDPIQTFSVGVGEIGSGSFGYDPKFMAQVAVNGGTAKAGCDPNDTTGTKFCHFQITPGAKTVAQVSQEFVDAINEIRGLASDCEILLTLVDKDGKPADPTKVQVDFVDKDDPSKKISDIPKDVTNGWSYDDDANPTKILLHGGACDEVRKKKAVGKVRVKLGCKVGGG